MFFWWFMLAASLVIPLTLVGFGARFMRRPPQTVNAFYGYRTRRSMQNRDTWLFAHKTVGRIWFYSGLALLPLSTLALALVRGKGPDTVGAVGGLACLCQLVPLAGAILPTERILEKHFDENGRRR